MSRTRNVRTNYARKYLGTQNPVLFSSKPPVLGPDIENKPAPAPVYGWDAISPISDMEPKYAVILDNAVVQLGGSRSVAIRGGCRTWFQGAGGDVQSLLAFRPAEASEQLFAAANGNIWNISTYGSPSLSASGFTSDKWQYINFTPAGGTTRLIAVNGTDDAQIYDGVSWADLSVTGISISSLINIATHKRRIWFVEKESTSAWYLATDAIAGAATEFQLGSLFSKGSYLVAMGIWTVDGGNGPDDLAVFVSNKGQAVVFKGTDPNNADAWFHVGTFNLPPPLGRRCFLSFGSDLLYISMEGLLPISKALPFDPSGARSVALTNRIQNAMLQAAQEGRTFFGWQAISFPQQGLLILNVPVVEGEQQVQFVMNANNGFWSRFTGWNANCFEIFNESLFFGDNDGRVFLAYTGQADSLEPIALDIKGAFNYFDDPGRQKYVNMLRPYLEVGGEVQPQFGIAVDFGDDDFNPVVSEYQQFGSLWDSAVWDTATWQAGGNSQIVNDWQSIGAIGTALSIRMKINLTSQSASLNSGSVFDTGTFDDAVFDADGIPGASGDDLPVVRINSYQVNMEHGAPIG